MPTAGTEAALRSLVAGLASGSPDYDKLSPQFARVVRRDLPMTHPMFSSMGELRSVTFRGRGPMGGDVYDLVFANGGVTMSAALDADGRMAGGILQPVGPPAPPAVNPSSVPTAGTEAALAEPCRRAGERLARLRQTLSAVRRSRPPGPAHDASHVQLDGRAEVGDFPRARPDGRRRAYNLVFANGAVMIGRARRRGRMAGGILRPGAAWALTVEANFLTGKRNVRFPPIADSQKAGLERRAPNVR